MSRPEVLLGLFSRTAQTAILVGSAALVAWRLPVAAQGYFWAMGGLAALVQVFDLALTQVVLQAAAHHAARGEQDRLARLWCSAKRIACWQAPAGALFVLAAGFALLGAAETDVAWRGPWISFVLGAAAAQALSPALGFFEGAVSIAESWRFQLRLETAAGALLVLGLALGAGLWSLPLYSWGRVAQMAGWLARRRSVFPRGAEPLSRAEWMAELWPFQWKLAVSAVTSFLIFRALTPIVLSTMGAEAAARFGLSVAVMSSWLAITVAWPSSQIGRIGRLASERKSDELRAAFRRMLLHSTALAATGAALILGGLWAAQQAGLPFAERSAGFAATGLLLASAVLQHAVLCVSVLLRSERRDPLLPYSIAGSLITAAALWTAAAQSQLLYVASAYFACSCLGVLMGWHAFATHVPAWRSYLRAA